MFGLYFGLIIDRFIHSHTAR